MKHLNYFLLIVIVFALPIFVYSLGKPISYGITKMSAIWNVGIFSKNCGIVEIDQSPESVNACMQKQISDKKSGFARYYLSGIDSIMAKTLLLDNLGNVRIQLYDGAPCGGIGCIPKIIDKKCKKILFTPIVNRPFICLT